MDNRFLHENLAHDLSKVTPQPIAILGCGAIGSNLAESLARRGFSQFHLLDRSRIRFSDIGTQVWFTEDIGQFKAAVLSLIIRRINPINIAVPYVVDAQVVNNLYPCISRTNLVVDCFDNRAARELTVKCHQNVLHISLSSVGTCEIQWDEGYKLPVDVLLADPCNYPLSRSLIEVTIGMASHMIIRFFFYGVKDNYKFALEMVKEGLVKDRLFGWDLPPGCTNKDIDDAFGERPNPLEDFAGYCEKNPNYLNEDLQPMLHRLLNLEIFEHDGSRLQELIGKVIDWASELGRQQGIQDERENQTYEPKEEEDER